MHSRTTVQKQKQWKSWLPCENIKSVQFITQILHLLLPIFLSISSPSLIPWPMVNQWEVLFPFSLSLFPYILHFLGGEFQLFSGQISILWSLSVHCPDSAHKSTGASWQRQVSPQGQGRGRHGRQKIRTHFGGG